MPKSLRKIPADFHETFPRKYSYDTRLAILCRIYRNPDFIHDKELKEHWKKATKVFENIIELFRWLLEYSEGR